jgi:hypothetical protein
VALALPPIQVAVTARRTDGDMVEFGGWTKKSPDATPLR